MRRRRQRRLRHPAHEGARNLFRTAGPILAVIGIALIAIGMIDFFVGFGDFGHGIGLFWMTFLGMPFLIAGMWLIKAGYLGAAARYVAGEVAPVASDAFDYMARASRDGIREVVGAVAEGLREGGSGGGSACPSCGERNDSDANFCDNCGVALATVVFCPSCRVENDPDANFCSGCGAKL